MKSIARLLKDVKELMMTLLFFVRRRDDDFDNPYLIM
jgi:hypothetical protein